MSRLAAKIAIPSEGASTAPSETSPKTGLRRQSRRSNEGYR
jgi:hypothetical protein